MIDYTQSITTELTHSLEDKRRGLIQQQSDQDAVKCWNQAKKTISLLNRELNQSLRSGQIPSEWKSADITPIHKKDSKEPAENYRSISLPIVSKVLEHSVFNCLYDHVNNLITPLQHRFLRNHSSVTQLLSVLHTIGQNLDKTIQTDIIYLDFACTFDTVDHNVLLSKLTAYRVSGQLLT